ncbi:MAG: flagellar motor switch protein FliG [Pseudomonadota bacterium]|nr:flagellar motor switch protein FliG [Pseudomonadota bacterium]
MNNAGLAKSAILLLSLGEAEASEVFKHLNPKEVQKIGQTMAKLKSVSRDKMEEVLANFHSQAEQHSTIGVDSGGYIRSVLTRALGDDKAGFLLDRILQGEDSDGIESLRWMDKSVVAELIKNEHPQIIASVLVYLERDHAADVAALLPERTRNDVLLRIATLDGIQPTAMRELNDVLAKLLSGSENVKKAPLGGARTAAEILNFMGSTLETATMAAMREYDAELAERIEDQMFVFENLLDLDDRGIQALLREVQSESLIIALKGASQELRDKIFANMSQRAGELLRDDLEAKGPVRVSEVEAEQKEMLKIVRRMSDDGQIVLGTNSEDAFV